MIFFALRKQVLLAKWNVMMNDDETLTINKYQELTNIRKSNGPRTKPLRTPYLIDL